MRVVENRIDERGVRRVRVMSDEEIDAAEVTARFAPEAARGTVKATSAKNDVLQVHSVTLEWPVREVVDVEVPLGGGDAWRRRVMLWKLTPGERVSEAIRAGAELYLAAMQAWPAFAWLAQMPSGADEGVEVDGVMLIQAEWVPPGCAALGGQWL